MSNLMDPYDKHFTIMFQERKLFAAIPTESIIGYYSLTFYAEELDKEIRPFIDKFKFLHGPTRNFRVLIGRDIVEKTSVGHHQIKDWSKFTFRRQFAHVELQIIGWMEGVLVIPE